MTEPEQKLKTIVDLAMSLLPRELGCDDCFEYFAAYAEHLIAGSAIPVPLHMVGEHLDRCAFCMEELELLLKALKDGNSIREG